MPVIARDAVASDHLVYAWPFPIGPEEYDVSCAEDELVVMCPAWLVGDRLGPGRHRWRTPDPSRPVSAYFVLTAPVEVSFDMITQFMLPSTGQSIRLRAMGSLQVRCMDPALLVAQFVGLPFDAVNDGVLRSVSRSIERMLARLLTRRVVMAGTPHAVTDPSVRGNIIEELVAYNPTAGAVFGVELMRFGHLSIAADDGTRPWQQMMMANGDSSRHDNRLHTPVPGSMPRAETSPLPENVIGAPAPDITPPPPSSSRALSATLPPPLPPPVKRPDGPPQSVASGEIVPKSRPGASQSSSTGVSASGEIVPKTRDGSPPIQASGEIVAKGTQPKTTSLGIAPVSAAGASEASGPPATGSSPGKPPPIPSMPPPPPASGTPAPPTVAKPAASGRRGGAVEVQNTDEPTHPGIDVAGKPLPGAPPAPDAPAVPAPAPATPPAAEPAQESRGSILGIGMSHIGSSAAPSGVASGEITKKIAPGGRVLVPGPNGLMQSATVRQLLQGYYELEVGGSGETIWVPVNGVVPE